MSDIDWSNPAAPRSRRYDDIYFSPEGGLAESRAVFLDGCGLPGTWAGRDRFVVAELGFGTGLNIAALLDLWRRAGPSDGQLHVFTVEAHPLSQAEAARALAHWPEIASATRALLDRWPPQTPGFHRLDLPEWTATVDVAVGEAAWALNQWRGRANAWFLDGFAPSRNPDMWSDAVLDGLCARSAPGARLATFTVAGKVRRGLAARGFVVERRPGHGRKRERLEARLPGETPTAAHNHVAVIGDGIAGASLARACAELGLIPTVVASGRGDPPGPPAALVTPRFDLGDAEIAGLNAQALARAAALYAATPGVVLSHGVLRLESADRDSGRFDRIAAQPLWRDDAMIHLDAIETTARLGEPVTRGGLWMGDAVSVDPATVRRAWLAGAARIEADIAAIAPLEEGGWSLTDRDGAEVLRADVAIVAGGWGTAGLLATPLSPVRGQATLIASVALSGASATWGGYVTAAPTGVMTGATHDRGDAGLDLRAEDDRANLERLTVMQPRMAEAAAAAGAVTGWAGVRATTPDRLPLCGPVPGQPGLFVLGGLGSRGFLMAPLLAEHLAALIAGAPSPLPDLLAVRVDPSRFGAERAAPADR